MKIRLLILMVMMMPMSLMGWEERTECVTVPKHHKIVFIPWLIPTDELTWKWQHAKEPQADDPGEASDGECERGVVVSPSIPDPDCD